MSSGAFFEEWEALIKLEKADKPKVPALSKSQTLIKWMESFKDCLDRTFGVRCCPLSYVVRETVVVPAEVDDPLIVNKAFGESGSVVDELIKRLEITRMYYFAVIMPLYTPSLTKPLEVLFMLPPSSLLLALKMGEEHGNQ